MKRITKNTAVISLLAFLLTTFFSVNAGAFSADLNNDGITDISDCTYIQMYLAQYSSAEYNDSLDVDGDGVVDVNDVTYLQIQLSSPATSDTATNDNLFAGNPGSNDEPEPDNGNQETAPDNGIEEPEPDVPQVIPPSSVTLNKTSASLKVGNTLTLSAKVNDGADAGAFTWSSSNSEVAVITKESGSSVEIKAMKLGTATITVKTYNGITAACKITVSGSAVKCLDVSTFQGTIDFNKVKNAGYDYVIIRAGFGKDANQEDDLFVTNYKNAKAAGLKVGAYWYSYTTTVANAEKEAYNCLASIKGKTFDLPVFYDIEESSQSLLSKTTLTNIADKFCSILESNGFEAGIYSTKSMFANMDVEKLKAEYAIWLAQVDGDFSGITADVHQYTWENRVNGISGDVDCNYIYNLNIVKNI